MNVRQQLLKPNEEPESLFRDVDLSQARKPSELPINPITTPMLYLLVFKVFLDPPVILIWFLFIVSISFTPYSPKISVFFRVSVPFALTLIIRALKFFSISINQTKILKKLRRKQYGVFIDKSFNNIKSKLIIEGDLVILKKNEIAPCDCLILSFESDSEKLFVKQFDLNDSREFVIKKPLEAFDRLIKSDGLSIGEVKKKIEWVKVVVYTNCLQDMSGKIKIKESPAYILAKDKNFIRAGSELADSDWVLGLVVSAGKNCKKWINYQVSSSKFESSFQKPLRSLFFFSSFVMSLFVILSMLEYRYNYGYIYGDESTEAAIQTIILFSNLFPVSLFLALEVFEAANWLLFNYKNSDIRVINPTSIEKLPLCEYVFAENVGVLTDSTISINFCRYSDALYKVDNKISSNENDSDYFIEKESVGNIVTVRPKFDICYKLLEDLQSELETVHGDEEKMLFGATLIICNEFINDQSELCKNTHDIALIEFAKTLGFAFKRVTKKTFEIKLNMEVINYTVIAAHSIPNKFTWYLIKNKTSEKNFLVLKVVEESGIDYLTGEHNLEIYKEHLQSPKDRELCKTLFLYRSIKNESVNNFIQDYNIAKKNLSNKLQMIISAIYSYLPSLKVLSEIRYSSNLVPGSAECLQSLRQAGLKVWILSNESSEKIIASGHQLKLIPKEAEIVHLSGYKTSKEASKKLEKILIDKFFGSKNRNSKFSETKFHNEKNIQKNKFSSLILADFENEEEKLLKIGKIDDLKDNLYICIDGKTLALGFSMQELARKLLYLMFAAETVFFCNLTPQCKKMIAKLVNEGIKFRPKILSIGYGSSSYLLSAETDVSIVISPNLKYNPYADIVARDVFELSSLIMNTGTKTHNTMKHIVLLMVFKEFCTIFVLFLFQTLTSFSGTPAFDFNLIVTFELLLSFLFILSSSWLASVTNENTQEFLVHSKMYKSIFFYSILGCVHGILIHFWVSVSFSAISNSLGFTQDIGTVSFTYFILVNFSLYIQALVYFKRLIRAAICVLLNMILLVIILAIAINTNLDEYITSSESITKSSTYWMLLCVFPWLLYTVSYSLDFSFRTFEGFSIKTRFETFKNRIENFADVSSLVQECSHKVNLEFDKVKMMFTDDKLENEYRIQIIKSIKFKMRVYIIIFTIIVIINSILTEIGLKGLTNIGRFYLIITLYCFIGTIISFIISERNAKHLELIFFISACVLSFFKALFGNGTSSGLRYPTFIIIFSLDLSLNWQYSIVKGCVFYALSIFATVYETYYFNFEDLPIHTSHWIVIMLINLILILIRSYQQELHRRNEFLNIKKISIEVEKSSAILSYLLPGFVRKRVKDGVRYIAEEKGTVSVIFCDIYDFDRILTMYTTKELTSLLNKIFERIDFLCDICGATKIETVGKTYMACTGLKDSEADMSQDLLKVCHARRAVDLALAIIKESKSLMLKDGSKLSFKIGVNSGPVTAGVVGKHKPQFSLVGDTVNTASRMASTLKDIDTVQISEETFQLLEDYSGLDFISKQIEAKGKGTLNTKLVFVDKKGSFLDIDNETDNSRRQSLSHASFLSNDPNRKISDSSKNIQQKTFRQSLIGNLEVRDASELFKIQTMKKIDNNWNFSCKESETEKKFRTEYINEIALIQFIGIIASVICNLLLIIAETTYILLNFNHSSLGRLITIIFEELGMIIALALWKRYSKNLLFSFFLSTLYTLVIIGIFVSNFYGNFSIDITFMYFSYNYLLLNFFSGNLFSKNFIFNAISATLFLVQSFLMMLDFQYIIYAFFLVIIVLYVVFVEEKKMRLDAVLKNLSEKELQKTEELLSYMMPPHALAELEMGMQVIDRVKLVTIMYADIVGFTAWSSVRSPTEIVSMLSELFTKFDQMCIEHSVYKVHTIGDCYVAMGYINENNRNPAKEAYNMVNFALSLIEVIQQTNEKCKINLGMRIGLHTGDIIGGITGTKVVRYDIYGPDVQIANKMESSGESGNVAVSETTKSLIEDFDDGKYSFQFVRNVEISSLNIVVPMHFVR